MAYTRNMPTYGYDFDTQDQGQYDGPVDWREVDAELSHVPAEFKDPRFDSLRQAANMKILKVGQMDTGERLKEVRTVLSSDLFALGSTNLGHTAKH